MWRKALWFVMFVVSLAPVLLVLALLTDVGGDYLLALIAEYVRPSIMALVLLFLCNGAMYVVRYKTKFQYNDGSPEIMWASVGVLIGTMLTVVLSIVDYHFRPHEWFGWPLVVLVGAMFFGIPGANLGSLLYRARAGVRGY